DFPGRKIYVGRNEGAQLSNLLIYEMDDTFMPMRVVHAQRGLIEPDRENKRLLMHIYDGRYEQRDDKTPDNLMKIMQGVTMEETTLTISLVELYEKNKKKKGMGSLTAGELLERLDAEKRAAGQLSEKDATEERSALKTEVNKRFSFSLASFAFALIG